MASLSFYSNWETLHEHLNPDSNIIFPQLLLPPPPPMDLLGFQDSTTTFIDPLFFPDDDYNYYNNINLLPYSASSFEHFSPQEFEPYPYPKHQKCYEDNYYHSDLAAHGLFNGFVPNPPLLLPGLEVPLPEFYYECGSTSNVDESSTSSVRKGGCNGGGGGGGGSLSAQSIAARQRRRKITGKTQELGKLIPGGHKMNTAEMFQAASKYIKYLQAQVGILELMGSIQVKNNEEPLLHTQQLQELVSSTRIQEKLYSSEKCLVPKQFVETLANDRELQLNSLILKELDQLIGTSG